MTLAGKVRGPGTALPALCAGSRVEKPGDSANAPVVIAMAETSVAKRAICNIVASPFCLLRPCLAVEMLAPVERNKRVLTMRGQRGCPALKSRGRLRELTEYPLPVRSGPKQKEFNDMAALPLIVFDVNETLLDLETMEPTFARIFGDKSAMRLWFANLILYSAALTVAGCYVPFTDIGSAVMKMLADTRGIKIDDKDKKELTEKFSTMPPHPEVPAALRKLRDAGFRLFTLTDNLLEVQTRQLEHGGIADLFERRFSADGVKHHKPSREAYAYIGRELAAEPSRFCLIACHTWDTLGAVAAGWEAALIKRAGNDVLGVGPQPQIVGDDLNDVANQLISRHKGRA
jgi:2-haloacid dehalogenase